MDLFDKCTAFTRANQARAEGWYPYFKEIQSGAGAEVMVDGRKMIMIGSNNYLGLTQHPKVLEASTEALKKYGSGCTGSRFLNGTLDIHTKLEEKLANFMKTEAALCFSTGFQTNLGTVSTIVGKSDTIYADRGNHASLVDGSRLAIGKTLKYRHNDMQDLERLLNSDNGKNGGKLIATDGVFSMEGDVVDLPAVMNIAKKHNARVMVDDAHSIGVLGKNGRGTAEHYNIPQSEVDLVMGTFSKSFASLGGFIAGKEYVVDYIKHHSRPFIFSASMPPSAVAAVIASVDIIENEPEHLAKLWANTNKMKKGFDEMGLNTGASATPIIPIHIGDDMATFGFWKALFEHGIFANPSITPAVPPGHGIIRTSYMATHTDEILDRVLDTFYKLGKQFDLI
ncbi:MAG: pyridoxal phosphate-dependent aminotransferase family protein [Deferribacteres bacterium]|nr:pyridoxal phosphate-dependent aminotransferase family protein [candidate division KSB1 bacterium]MCB9510880.1 pyridoxal phosphate-dependent aminotransferase family protein [Deferribacteres bacterium]